jgi:hypothetical protein
MYNEIEAKTENMEQNTKELVVFTDVTDQEHEKFLENDLRDKMFEEERVKQERDENGHLEVHRECENIKRCSNAKEWSKEHEEEIVFFNMFVSCAGVIKEITKMIDIQREFKLQGGYTCERKVDLHEASRIWDLGEENLTKVTDVDQFFFDKVGNQYQSQVSLPLSNRRTNRGG